jgi:hypothetical protein
MHILTHCFIGHVVVVVVVVVVAYYLLYPFLHNGPVRGGGR